MLTKSELRPVYDFKLVLRNLHNRLYGGGPIKTESRLADEVARLVLLKIADELSTDEFCKFFATQEELETELGRLIVLNRLRDLAQQFEGLFHLDFALGSYWVAEVVSNLQKYALLDSRSYLSPLADVYEVFNSGQFKGGRGQFFTPPVVVNLAFEILNPTVEDIVIDPACGAANFLSKVVMRFSNPNSPYFISNMQDREIYIRKHIFGRDIEPGLVNIAQTYLKLLSGGIPTNVSIGDSLDLHAKRYQSLPVGNFTKLFTNPPFGTNIEITNTNVLNQFDLGHQLSNGKKTKLLARGQHPDRLFLELCLKLLKPGGEAAIVLPRQILSGDETNATQVRKWLLDNATVLGVVDLPPETFQPYTGTITSLVILRKGAPVQSHRFFCAVCEHVGHDRRGLPLLQTDSDGNIVKNIDGEGKLVDDTPTIAQNWKQFQLQSNYHNHSPRGFTVDLDLVRQNPLHLLNAWAYNPDASEAYRLVMELAGNPNYESIAPLKMLCKEIFVPGRHKRKYVPQNGGSVPFLSTAQILQIHDVDYKYQPRAFANSQGLLVSEGWILVTRSGSTGRVRYVNHELSNYAISDHCIRVVPDEEKIDPGYLYAFLSSKVGQLLIDQGRYASVIETISHTRLGEIPIPLLPTEKQKEIGDIVREAEDARSVANVLRNKAIEILESSFE